MDENWYTNESVWIFLPGSPGGSKKKKKMLLSVRVGVRYVASPKEKMMCVEFGFQYVEGVFSVVCNSLYFLLTDV